METTIFTLGHLVYSVLHALASYAATRHAPLGGAAATKWLRRLSLRWHEQQRAAVAEVAAPVVAPQPATKRDGAAA